MLETRDGIGAKRECYNQKGEGAKKKSPRTLSQALSERNFY